MSLVVMKTANEVSLVSTSNLVCTSFSCLVLCSVLAPRVSVNI